MCSSQQYLPYTHAMTPSMTPRQQLQAGRLPWRLTQLMAGLSLFGVSNALMLKSHGGMDPWNVFHQGIALHAPLSLGTIIVVVALLVLLLWIPLKQWPGVGTVANALWIGVATDAATWLLPTIHGLAFRGLALITGITLGGFSIALYIGAQLGPGPRDGLMTGLSARTGLSIRLVRTCIELVVLALGWLLGGPVGVGTVLFALGVGPIVQFFLPKVTIRLPHPPTS